jgi:tetratricopeptide (TPR) repeat protein
VAGWIELHVRGEDAAELLAHHYSNALEYGRAAGRDVTEVTRRARAALRDAGRRAVALNSFVNAARFFEAAVQLMPEDDPDWPRLVLEQAEASVYVDISSDRRLASAREILLTGDVHDAARAEVVLGEYRWLRGDEVGSNEHFMAAEELAERMTDENAKLRVLANLGRFAMLRDDNERAVALGRPALALAEKLGRDDMRAHVLNNIGVARVALGEREGLDDLEASLEIARSARGGPEYVRACGNLASVLACEGQLQRSAELHREGLQISQEIGYEEPTRWLLTEIANDQMVAGKWEEARQIVDELIPGFEEAPFWIEPQTRVCRARMLIAEGAVEAAVVDADRAVAAVQGNSAFQGLCNPLAFRARLHAELGETKDAARVTAEVVDAWEETRSAYVEAWVLDVWFAAWSAGEEARLTAAVAAFPIAVPWLDVVAAFIERDFGKAAARLESMAAISDAALARLWAGEWLVEEGRHADAAVQLERALPFWRSVGARRYLRRCESLLAAAS